MGRAPLTPFEEDLAAFFGESAPCDSRAPSRDHVTFQPAAPATRPLEAAEDLVRHIRARNKARAHLSHDTRINARTHTSYSGAVTVRVGWQGQRFHTIRFSVTDGGELLASHKDAGGGDLSLILHDWLTASDRFSHPCWRTADEWKRRERGRNAPI
jgi:hypothetical protein